MRKLLLTLVIILAGCAGYELDPKWAPLEMVKDKPLLVTMVNPDMMTTIGNTVYVDDLEAFLEKHKPDSRSFNRIMTHERVHSIRQTAGIPLLGNAWWLLKYVFSTDFMWSEEQFATYFEYRYFIRRSPAADAKVFSEHYFSIFGIPMVPYEEALEWCKEAQANRWKPDLTPEEMEHYKTP